ncbi:MAG: glycosyltransferase, partial [Muribaculaceae bacterium]|nr:glycosyltransferase [Muribaculaceae bacterium]
DALRLMPSHDLYVLTSLRDASPRTVREAQALGLPCLISDIPGARDLIIDGKTGMLIPPGNPEALAAAIMNMAERREDIPNMGKNARQHIRSHFSTNDYVNFHANLFEKLK